MRVTVHLAIAALLGFVLTMAPGCDASKLSESSAESGQDAEDTGEDSDGGEEVGEGDQEDSEGDDGV